MREKLKYMAREGKRVSLEGSTLQRRIHKSKKTATFQFINVKKYLFLELHYRSKSINLKTMFRLYLENDLGNTYIVTINENVKV